MKTEEKKFFPMFVDLSEKKAVVLGAGVIATRRVKTLLDFVGELAVIAPVCTEEMASLAAEGKLVYRQKSYEREDLYDADLVLAATDDEKVNEDIYSACKCLGIPVNTASNQLKCDFHFPGILEYDGVVLGFNGSGKNHKKVKEVRQTNTEGLRTKPKGRGNMRKIIIGSRESRLAVVQSEMVKKAIENSGNGVEAEICTMKTTGDKILDRTLDKIGGKGLFVKELDKALLDKRTDISVHSLKDMPMEVSEECTSFGIFQKRGPKRCAGASQRNGYLG